MISKAFKPARRAFALSFLSFLLLAIATLSSCGGGTTGTGGSGPIFSGRVVGVDGAPLPGVAVTLDFSSGPAASGVTDQNGEYNLRSPTQGSAATLSFDGAGIAAVATVPDIASDTVEIACNITLEAGKPEATITDRVDERRKRGTPTPEPSATVEPTSAPGITPEPTATPTATVPAVSTRAPETLVLGSINPSIKRLILNTTVQINSAPARRVDPTDGTFEFTLRRNISGGTLTINVAAGRIVTVALPELPGVPGRLAMRIRLNYDQASGELSASIGRYSFDPF